MVPKMFKPASAASDDCPCSKADMKNVPPLTEKRKEVTATISDRLRSVSYSSDKFPPASLNLARVSHQDQLPMSPSCTMSGVVPLLPSVDNSVPPPSLPTPPPSLSPPPLTFNMAKKRAYRAQRSPRISVSEICDTSSPQPVPVPTTKSCNMHIKFSLAS